MKKPIKLKYHKHISKKTQRKTSLNGFTLVELIVVIAIIGILAIVLIPSMIGRIKDAKLATANDAAAKVAEQAKLISTELYANNSGTEFSNKAYRAETITMNEFKTEIELKFKEEMLKALPDLKQAAWAVSFDASGNVDGAVYCKKGTKYLGTYPNRYTQELDTAIVDTKNEDGTVKENSISSLFVNYAKTGKVY